MSYVRTKDGVYKTTKKYVITPKGYVAWHDFYDPIIAQADTIEELLNGKKSVLGFKSTQIEKDGLITFAMNVQSDLEELLDELKESI